MSNVLQKINFLWGGVVALMTAIFGQFWFLFFAFLLLNVADYITGVFKARIKKVSSSAAGLSGIIKKVCYWLVIAIAFFIAYSFGILGGIIGVDLEITVFIGWITLATFIVNEIRSILENLVVIGVKVPEFLIKGLEVASQKIGECMEGKDGCDK